MYDIRIFIESDGTFGGRIKAGKEVIYGVGENREELLNNLKDGIAVSFGKQKLTPNTTKLVSFLDYNNKKNLVCH